MSRSNGTYLERTALPRPWPVPPLCRNFELLPDPTEKLGLWGSAQWGAFVEAIKQNPAACGLTATLA